MSGKWKRDYIERKRQRVAARELHGAVIYLNSSLPSLDEAVRGLRRFGEAVSGVGRRLSANLADNPAAISRSHEK